MLIETVLPTLAQPTAADAYALSAGRLGAIVAALSGLAAVALGGLALARTTGRRGTADTRPDTGRVRRGAAAALVAGPSGMGLGAVVAVTADGGLGTGTGLGGAYVALLVGLTGTTLAALALTRTRHR